MKKMLTAVALLAASYSFAQNYPPTPDQIYGQLFVDVQMQQVLPDGKTFVDCTPKRPVKDILQDYEQAKNNAGFDLKKFVLDNFNLPKPPPQLNYIQHEKNVVQHLTNLWGTLTRQPDEAKEGSSLLPLPYPYVVPGGRFREMYYWDSYFTMLGLKESGQTDLLENMVKNFDYLIQTYGHIPNGTRSYYLTRSQPPFFALMVDLLAAIKGDEIYKTYLSSLEKEHQFFMEGVKEVKPGEVHRRVVRMPNGIALNRYWDDSPTPRQESYREDVLTTDTIVMNRMMLMRFKDEASMEQARKDFYAQAYTNLRAAAESGIDFSTRWFADEQSILTIETTNMIPPDLNALMYHLEETLAKAYALTGDKKKQHQSEECARLRKEAVNEYCYDAATGYYYDYNFIEGRRETIITPAGMYPFCLFPEKEMTAKAENAASVIKANLLKDGGVVTTVHNSGQQWDAPNGWAPLNWMTIWGLDRCGQQTLAKDIASRWCQLNADVYQRTSKMLEKYNVVDTHLESGGGEYPTQDGFGWTNGVYLALVKKYNLPIQ